MEKTNENWVVRKSKSGLLGMIRDVRGVKGFDFS